MGGGIFGSSLINPAFATNNTANNPVHAAGSSTAWGATDLWADIATVLNISAPVSCTLSENNTDPSTPAGSIINPTTDGTIATCRYAIKDPDTGETIEVKEGEDVLVSTNNLTGYKLYMSIKPDQEAPQNNALTHTTSTATTKPSIPSLSSASPLDSSFPKNKWGYNVPSLPSHGNDYQPLPPVVSDPTAGHNISEKGGPAPKDTINVRFATKIDFSQETGTYSNKVLYTAIVNDVPEPTVTSMSPDSLPVGNSDSHQVALTGANLTKASKIKIGDADCTNIHAKSDAELTCEVGPSRQLEDETTIFYKAGMSQGAPTMQAMTPQIANNTSMPTLKQDVEIQVNGRVLHQQDITYYQEATLRDIRDDKTYTVTKLKDGKVWMNQNLDLNLDSFTPLTSELSDISADRTWVPQTTYTASSQWISVRYDSLNSIDMGNYYYDGTTNQRQSGTSYDGMIGFSITGNPHYHVGNLYSWNAATANSRLSSEGTGEATDSICPKGWRLPKGGSTLNEFSNMLSQHDAWIRGTSGTVQNLLNNPIYMVRGGFVLSRRLNDAVNDGDYWSSTATSSTNGYNLGFNGGSYVSPASSNYRYLGLSLRCVVRTENVNPPTPTPDPTPSNNASDDNGGTLRSSAAPATSGASSVTGATDDPAYSDPQGVRDASLKHFVENGGPNWFLFIFLLVLSILALGVSLFIFWKKHREQAEKI